MARCGWCAVIVTHADLGGEIHELHVRQGLGSRALRSLAKRRLDLLGERTPSARPLSRHLQRHLKRDVDAEQGGPLAPSATLEAGEFEVAWVLLARLERRFEQLDNALSITSTGGEVDVHRMAQLAGLANSMRAVIETISRVRGSTDTHEELGEPRVEVRLQSRGHPERAAPRLSPQLRLAPRQPRRPAAHGPEAARAQHVVADRAIQPPLEGHAHDATEKMAGVFRDLSDTARGLHVGLRGDVGEREPSVGSSLSGRSSGWKERAGHGIRTRDFNLGKVAKPKQPA